MRRTLLLAVLGAALAGATPVEYNNSAWYSGLDPHLVGKRENFLIQGVSVDAVQDSSGFTGAFRAVLKFNYGGPTPEVGNLSTISPYDFNSGGVISTLMASDLFFKSNGTLQYGIPLVTHGGGLVNGRPQGASVFDSGDLYHIANGVQTVTSDQFLRVSTPTDAFGSGRAVRIAGSMVNPPSVANGTVGIHFNGQCTDAICPQAEYTVTLDLFAVPELGSQWYLFLAGIADGTLTPYFTGTVCGNDLLDGSVPEPGTWATLAAGLGFLVLRSRKRN